MDWQKNRHADLPPSSVEHLKSFGCTQSSLMLLATGTFQNKTSLNIPELQSLETNSFVLVDKDDFFADFFYSTCDFVHK